MTTSKLTQSCILRMNAQLPFFELKPGLFDRLLLSKVYGTQTKLLILKLDPF